MTTKLLPAGLLAILALAAQPVAASGAPHDRDRDGLPDRWERLYDVRSATADHDKDGLGNLTEYRTAHDPTRRDSDGDGIADGAEGAGRVVSVEGGTVTIALAARITARGSLLPLRMIAGNGRRITGHAEPAALTCRPAAAWRAPREGGRERDRAIPHLGEGRPGVSFAAHNRARSSLACPAGIAPGDWVHEAALAAPAADGVAFAALRLVG
jgi:hypothetical protein